MPLFGRRPCRYLWPPLPQPQLAAADAAVPRTPLPPLLLGRRRCRSSATTATAPQPLPPRMPNFGRRSSAAPRPPTLGRGRCRCFSSAADSAAPRPPPLLGRRRRWTPHSSASQLIATAAAPRPPPPPPSPPPPSLLTQSSPPCPPLHPTRLPPPSPSYCRRLCRRASPHRPLPPSHPHRHPGHCPAVSAAATDSKLANLLAMERTASLIAPFISPYNALSIVTFM